VARRAAACRERGKPGETSTHRQSGWAPLRCCSGLHYSRTAGCETPDR